MIPGADRARGARRGRLLIVGSVPPPSNGVTVMTAALLRGNLRNQFDVVHADTSDHRSLSNIGSFEPTNVALALRHAAEFAALLRGHKPDLVYLSLSQGLAGFLRDAVFLMTARLARTPVTVHAHGAGFREFYGRSPAVLRGLMRSALVPVQDIVVLTASQQRQFDGWAPATARISVVPNGVVDEWRDGTPPRSDRVAASVLYLGTMLPQKGFLDVLDAVPAVVSRAPSTRFIFAGEPVWDRATVQAVKKRLAHPSVRRSVSFVGAVGPERRHELLERADLLVFPPRWEEGQGLVAIEAMSAALPLVVTASGGLAETVRDGVEGLSVPKCSPHAVADGILRLLGDPELRARLGAAGRARYEAEYTIEKWQARMQAVLSRAGWRFMTGTCRPTPIRSGGSAVLLGFWSRFDRVPVMSATTAQWQSRFLAC